jgi:hypothetical protein
VLKGGARPASDQPYLILKAGAPIDGDPRHRHARDPSTVRQGTTLMMITLMWTNRTAVGPARRRYSTIRGGGGADWGFDSIWRRLKIVRGWRSLALRNLGSARDGLVSRGQKRTKEQCSAWSHGLTRPGACTPSGGGGAMCNVQCAMSNVQCSCPM